SVFVTWLAEVCIGIALLTVLTPPENAAYSAIGIFALLTLGPTAGLLAMLPLGRALIVIALLVALRELVARGLWAWTVRAARE
ncbi:MAG: hypothetical protein JXQ72_15230, partial [Anaerolineae bacterium]|nr:hypothetical protein [Anaerolineae bacterium]